MAEPAHCARHLVRTENSLAEPVLVNALANGPERVGATQIVARIQDQAGLKNGRLVRLDGEDALGSIVADDVDRPYGQISAGNQTVEVDEGNLFPHRAPKTDIVGMARFGGRAAIAVGELISCESVAVRGLSPLNTGDGEDAEGKAGKRGGLEDALGPDQGNPGPFEPEALGKQCPRQHVAAMASNLLGDPGESRGPDCTIPVGPRHVRDGKCPGTFPLPSKGPGPHGRGGPALGNWVPWSRR